MINYEEQQFIVKTTRDLSIKHPIEANYGSRASLWGCGLEDGSITRELYDKAAKHYGRLWYYVGD